MQYLPLRTKICIKIDYNLSDCYDTTIGSPQGDNSNSILFTFYLKKALKALSVDYIGKKLIYPNNVNFITKGQVHMVNIFNALEKNSHNKYT